MLTAQRSYELGPPIDGAQPFSELRTIVRQAAPGGIGLEFGVGSGRSTRIIAAVMRVVGFDSFNGLPEDWRPGFGTGRFSQAAPPVIDNCNLVIGRFEDTLPDIDFTEMWPVSLVHIDCDLYSSTRTVLEHIGPVLKPGVIVVFDEWHGYPGAEAHEQRAWREYATANPDLGWDVLGHGPEAWVIRIA